MGHIQGFLAHLAVHQITLLFMEPLALPGPDVRQGMVEVGLQIAGEETDPQDNSDEGQDPAHQAQHDDAKIKRFGKRNLHNPASNRIFTFCT